MTRLIGNYKIRGNGHHRELYHNTGYNNGEHETVFFYKGDCYYLDDFVRIESEEMNSPFTLKDDNLFGLFDGIMSLTYFSGLLIKLSPCGDAVQVYDYYNMER